MKMRELPQLQQQKWYAVAVGEIGIPPSEFYEMTEDELLWAYQGHRKQQEDMANIILLALIRFNTENKNKPFQFIDVGYDIGSLEDRKNTFTILGIKEE